MNFSGLKVIVTGGAGFIGSNLVKRLILNGAAVSVVDNLWRGKIDNLKLKDGSYAIDLERDFYLVDLTDYSKCLEVLREADVVYHLADVVGGVQFAFEHETFIFRQNMLINSNTLSACLLNGIRNYIYVGTACSFPKHLQMNRGFNIVTEDQTYPAAPESSYGWSKLMGEYEAELAKSTEKINVGILRLHNVYGPGASFDAKTSQVIPSLIRKACLFPSEPFIVWGSGTQYRDFIYVDDVAEALLLIYEKGMNKGVIQIGSEIATTIKELAEMIIAISGKEIELKFDISKPEGDFGRISNCDRSRAILGWKPQVCLQEGLEKTYEWVAKRIKAH